MLSHGQRRDAVLVQPRDGVPADAGRGARSTRRGRPRRSASTTWPGSRSARAACRRGSSSAPWDSSAASSSSGPMTWLSGQASSPWWRGASTSTPRPTKLSRWWSMPSTRPPPRVGHVPGPVAVVHRVLPHHVAERVPLGRALGRHLQHVVAPLEAGRGLVVGAADDRVASRSSAAAASARAGTRARAPSGRSAAPARRPCRVRTRPAAATRSAGPIRFWVPRWSSSPQRPQLLGPSGR